MEIIEELVISHSSRIYRLTEYTTVKVVLIYGIPLLQDDFQHDPSEILPCEKTKPTSFPKPKLEKRWACLLSFLFDLDNIYITRYLLSYLILFMFSGTYFYILFEIHV